MSASPHFEETRPGSLDDAADGRAADDDAESSPAALAAGRSRAEEIARLAGYLARPDRDLLLAVFVRGLSIAELARAAGQSRRWINRRLRRLLDRIRRPEFAFIAAHHEAWPPLRRHAAALVLLQRRSRAEAARVLRVSTYTIRRELDAVAILIDQARAMGRLRPTTAQGRERTRESERHAVRHFGDHRS